MENKIFSIVIITLIVVLFSLVLVSAQDEEPEDAEIFGLEVEKLLVMFNAWIATFLFVLAFMAYRRDGRKRLFYVSLAFLLFAIRSFLIASELFIDELPFIDPIAVVLEFGVLLSFFYGVLKK